MFVFRKIWRALFSRNTRFEIRSFALLQTNYEGHLDLTIKQFGLLEKNSYIIAFDLFCRKILLFYPHLFLLKILDYFPTLRK